MLEVVIVGGAGRMGRALLEAAEDSSDILVKAVTVRDASARAAVAKIISGTSNQAATITTDLTEVIAPKTIVIDFTTPAATLTHVAIAQRASAAMVIGTTGFSQQQLAALNKHSTALPLVVAGNFSLGVNISLALIRQAAALLNGDADIEITEAHHRDKVDSPSGTALMMGQAAAEGLGAPLQEVATYSRYGQVGARQPGSIGFSSIRGGDIVGEHAVMFACAGERLEIAHKATSRLNFARGAIRAALWLSQQTDNGLYSMEDVLGLR